MSLWYYVDAYIYLCLDNASYSLERRVKRFVERRYRTCLCSGAFMSYLSVVEARRRLMILQQTLIDISRNDGGRSPALRPSHYAGVVGRHF